MELSSYNNCCILIHGFMIFYEVLDKFVDISVVNSYGDGNITDDPKDSVHKALFGFFIIGLLPFSLRVLLYLWRIYLYRADDNSLDESRIPTNLWMSFAKVWLEAFPQSTIAISYFGKCASNEDTKLLVQVFDFFSMVPFVMFACFTIHYYCTHEEGHYRVTTFVLAITFLLSTVGIIFAGISMTNFNESCRPYDYWD